MQPKTNVPLASYSTMRLGGTAAYELDVTNRDELRSALTWAGGQALPVLMIGGGSNIVWRDEGFPGLMLVNKITGYQDFDEDGINHYITVGAGELWDSVVARTVASGLTGIEALSSIPGTAGATPIQNVGAYGQEIAQTLVSVEAYDSLEQKFINLPAADCGFSYRNSRFKSADKGRFYITGLTLHLIKGNPEPPFYEGVQRYFDEQHITTYTPEVLRSAVVAIRARKLPDPAMVANNGSFFANPVVSEGAFTQLSANHPDMPHWPAGAGKVKLSAAWMIEQAGFKDAHDPATGMATWPSQPLVLVNEHAQHTADLLSFKQKIVDAVQTKFGVTLQQEPELLP